MINVVLCGGNGTRLWPLSRTLFPKQFNKLISDQSLFQMTVERNKDICKQTFIVSNQEHYFHAVNHLEEIGHTDSLFLLEPMGRNTAPAIALTCLAVDANEVLLVTPSDHIVKNKENYLECIRKAEEFAKSDYMVTFGIKPHYPETGYGYIEAEGSMVLSFKEKPSSELAQQYIKSGNFLWNSGMFMFKAGVYLEQLRLYAPDIYESAVTAFSRAHFDEGVYRVAKQDMEAIRSDSIDYAVMERSGIVKVVAADIGWSDLGSFESLYQELPQDEHQNTVTNHQVLINSSGNLVHSSKTVALVDVDDLLIVDTDDALLISRQGSSQKVKHVVEQLKQEDSELCYAHVTSYRPWGHHTLLDSMPNYRIKTVIVKPGREITAQKHFHRNEHWIVVSGTALIKVNGEESLLRPNESTFIRAGDEHSVSNPGKIDLHLIEVQAGEYVSEDDIMTF